MSSYQERLAARRTQLQQARFCTLPVPGYEDLLAVRYRILGREELKVIGKKNAKLDEDEAEIVNATDTLIDACEELLEVKGEKEYASTGLRWSSEGAGELFGVTATGGRDVLFAVFPPTQTELMAHFLAYDSHLLATAPEVDGEILGESEARSVTEELSISQ